MIDSVKLNMIKKDTAMHEQERHEMVFEKTHTSGAEEWYCPICGRRMLINWQPQFKKIILKTGDDYAMHSATKGLLPIGPLRVTPVDGDTPRAEPEALIEDSRLAPWMAWLDEVGFESLWNDEDQ